ncbi:MAG: hypothetical protein J6O90_02715 [Candidatus Methanomethylophilaceae archaeon]|nr:hypothetical protein [Candidatus Methanomethylophilaceae archaeon]
MNITAKEFIRSVAIGIAFVWISAVLAPYVAKTLLAPLIADIIGNWVRDWYLFETLVTFLSMGILILIRNRFGINWQGIAEKGGIVGIIVGIALLVFLGADKLISAGLAIAFSWLFRLVMDRKNRVRGSEIPIMPIVFLLSFLGYVAFWYLAGGHDVTDILSDAAIVFMVMPAYLALALPGVGKEGMKVALFVEALWILFEAYTLVRTADSGTGLGSIISVAIMLVYACVSPVASEKMYHRARKVRINRR